MDQPPIKQIDTLRQLHDLLCTGYDPEHSSWVALIEAYNPPRKDPNERN